MHQLTIAFPGAAFDTKTMRVIYLVLGFFVLFGVAATCRTPSDLPDDCERLDGGLVRCTNPAGNGHD